MSADALRAAIAQLDAALDAVDAAPWGDFSQQARLAEIAMEAAFDALYEDAHDRRITRQLARDDQ
jgi:hypothetical protein